MSGDTLVPLLLPDRRQSTSSLGQRHPHRHMHIKGMMREMDVLFSPIDTRPQKGESEGVDGGDESEERMKFMMLQLL